MNNEGISRKKDSRKRFPIWKPSFPISIEFSKVIVPISNIIKYLWFAFLAPEGFHSPATWILPCCNHFYTKSRPLGVPQRLAKVHKGVVPFYERHPNGMGTCQTYRYSCVYWLNQKMNTHCKWYHHPPPVSAIELPRIQWIQFQPPKQH